MNLTWLKNGFICRELYAPYIIDRDNDYYGSLQSKYNTVLKQAESAGADSESIAIIKKYKNKILESLNSYYNADLSKSSTIVRNLIRDIGNDTFAVNMLSASDAFPGIKNNELQFFRCRLGNPSNAFTAKDMLHLPKKCGQNLATIDLVFREIQVCICPIHHMGAGLKQVSHQQLILMFLLLFLMEHKKSLIWRSPLGIFMH